MKTKKLNKILVSAMATILACSAFGLMACNSGSAPEDKFVQVAGSSGLKYELNDDGDAYTLVSFGDCTDTDVVVGNWYNGMRVTALGEAVFNDEDNYIPVEIKSITVSSGIEAMNGMRCLQNMTVQKVILGDDVPILGQSALRKCRSLKVVVLGKGLKEIKGNAFSLLTENDVKIDLYYKGSESDWNKITKGDGNDYLTTSNCTMHYNYTGDGSEL